VRRTAAILLLAGASVLAFAPAAHAHALVSSSVPAPGAQLDRAPGAVTIVFTEAPEVSLSSIHILNATGATFDRGRAAGVAGNPKANDPAVK
jgi:methionine-rich copper-binding protein CopC